MQHYFKFRPAYTAIKTVLEKGKYKRIIIYVDLPSIARGFYNADVVHLEIDNYIQTQSAPTLFFEEARQFYNALRDQFISYNPYFITFFDNGQCIQNKTISKSYKGERSSVVSNLVIDDDNKALFKSIKSYYFNEFGNQFNIQNLSGVIDTEDYEGDFVPYYFIKNNYMDSLNDDCLNLILSTDKDLLQTCKFKNTIMCATVYKKSIGKMEFNLLWDDNAISYIYKPFKRGFLNSEYIPLILSLAGDKADNISGIKGVGNAKAILLITTNVLPPYIYKSTPLPAKLEEHRDLIIKNLKLISFDGQLERIPLTQLNKCFTRFSQRSI